jgi:hypothetical protein
MSDAAKNPEPNSRERAAAGGDPPNEDSIDRLLASVASEGMSVEDDPRWARLAAGELDPAETAELEALAASSEEARFLYQACQPLGQDFQARMVAAIEAQRAAELSEQESGAAKPTVLPFKPRPAVETRHPGRPRTTWWRPATLGAGLVTLAAAALILVMRPVVMAPLPGYVATDLQIATGERGAATDPAPAITLCAHCGLSFTLTPETTVDGEVAALFYALPAEGGGVALPVSVEAEAHASGVFRVQLAPGHGLAPGDYQLLALIGRPDALADPQALLAEVAAGKDRGPTWRSVRTSLRIE